MGCIASLDGMSGPKKFTLTFLYKPIKTLSRRNVLQGEIRNPIENLRFYYAFSYPSPSSFFKKNSNPGLELTMKQGYP